MKARSESKVKVAPGFSSAILFLCLITNVCFAQLATQEFSPKKINIRCENMPLEKVLDQLTRQSGLRFVYSSSTIETHKPVTLQGAPYSLDHLLEIISSQVDITFKRQGDYVVIKKNPGVIATVIKPNVAPREITHSPASTEETEYEIPVSRLRDYPVYAGITGDETLSKDFFRNGPGLLGWDTAFVIKNLPLLLSAKSTYQYHKRWFASAGLFMNDYSGGLELQAGIPAAYAVISGSFIKAGLFRFGYGVGTSIPIKPAISANLSYTFSALKSVEYDGDHNAYRATAQHHQARLMTNINLSRHFSLRVGPTLNFMNSYYRPEEATYSVAIVRSRDPHQYYMPLPQIGYTEIIFVHAPKTVKEYKTTKSWVGFEAGIAYRVNFSIRK